MEILCVKMLMIPNYKRFLCVSLSRLNVYRHIFENEVGQKWQKLLDYWPHDQNFMRDLFKDTGIFIKYILHLHFRYQRNFPILNTAEY